MGTFEFIMTVVIFLKGITSILLPILGLSDQDMWLAALVAWAFGMGYLFFLSFCKEPAGRHPLARAVLSLYALLIAALITRSIGEISNMTILPKTPQVVLNTLIVLLAAYATSKGIEAISRLAVWFMAVFVAAEVILFIQAIPVLKPEHLQPVFEHSFSLIMKDAIPFISFPFMETVVLLPLLSLVKKPQKTLLIGGLTAGALLFIVVISMVMVLPPDRIKFLISPVFDSARSLPGTNFVLVLLVLLWLQTGFFKLAVVHFVVVKQLGAAFNLDHQKIIIPVSILIINLSTLIFNNIIEFFYFAFKIYPFFAIPIQIGIPLYFFIVGRSQTKNIR